MGSTGMNIGDAVLTFVGDASQLDQTLRQVNSAAQSQLAPAKEQAQKLGAAIDDAADSATSAQVAFENLARKTVDHTIAATTLRNTLRALATGELPMCDSTIKSLSQDMQKATVATTAKAEAMRALKTALEPAAAGARDAANAEDQHTRSLTDARLAAQLAGREIGVTMPRALTTLIARSETIGPLLNAAFSGIAVVGFIQLAVTAGEKIYEFIQSLHELTAAEKQGLSDYTSLLQAAEQRSQRILALERERQLIGKTAADQAQLRAQFAQQDSTTLDGLLQREQKRYDLAVKTEELFKAGALRATGKTVTKNIGHGETVDMPEMVPAVTDAQMKQAEATVQKLDDLYGKGLEKLRNQVAEAGEQIGVKQQEAGQAALQQYIQNGETILTAQKQKDQAEIAERRAQAALDFETGKISLAQLLALTQQYDQQEHDALLKSLEGKRALLQKDPTKNAAAIKATNLEIEAENSRFRTEELTHNKDAYAQQAQAVIAAAKEQVAATKAGTAERVAAEQKLTDIIRGLLGEDSKLYKAQLDAQTAATREYNDAQIRLANQLALIKLASEQKLTKDSIAAGLKYFEAQYQQGQITYAQLVELKRQALQQEYQLDVDALNQAINELDPSKIAERKKLEGDLKLAKQKETEAEKALDQQAANASVLIEEKKQLEIKKLRAQNGVAGAVFTDADEKRLEKVNNTLGHLQATVGQVSAKTKIMDTIFKAVGIDMSKLPPQLTAMERGAIAVAGAVATMAEAWAQGGETMAQAAEKTAAAVLQSLAQMAFAKGTEELAEGWGFVADGEPGLAAAAFTSSAEWFAAGGLAEIGAGLINRASSGGSSSSGGSTSSGVSVAPGDAAPAANPVQTVNVQRFATGAVFTKPTLLSPATMRMVGDSISGGAADEAVIPLEDPRALKKIAAALGPHLAGGGDTHNHFHINGMISDDKMDKVIDKINTRVNGGKKLVASHARRLEKR